MQVVTKRTSKVLALGMRNRSKGQMTDPKTGEVITWPEATMLQYLPLGMTEGEIRKSAIAPEALVKVQNALIEVHWGCVVEVTIENRQIIDIEVLLDSMSAFCEE